jgi:hypothetical protein
MVLAVIPPQATVQLPSTVATRLRQALSKQTKIPPAKLKVVEATPKTWPDGCLGLAKADEMCTEALVTGWRVVFSNGNQRWIYLSDKQARVYRLEPQPYKNSQSCKSSTSLEAVINDSST